MNTNAIAIHGNFTEDGSSLLSCDPHVGLSAPPHFSLIEMSFGDNFVSGTTVPGIPGIVMGRTKYIAWGGTTAYSDNVDLWQEKVNDQFTKYEVDG